MAKPKLALIPAAQGDKFYSVLPSDGVGDFDFTRNSSATRIAPTGFIETSELFGSELVTNGNFDNDSDWNKGTGWTISGGTGNCDGTGANALLYQNNIFISGKNYNINFRITSYTSGVLRLRDNGVLLPTNYTAIGNYTLNLTATQTGFIGFQNYSSFIGSIDNISVVEVIGKSRLNYDLLNGKVVNCPHYLLEPARTNLITYSEDFSQWTLSNVTVNLNQIISPDGSLNANKIIATATNGSHAVFLSLSSATSSGSSYCYSFFAKAEEYTKTAIRIGGSGYSSQPMAVINLLNGTVISQQGFTSVSVSNFNNGWYKINAVFTATASVAPNIQPIADGFITTADNYTYTGDGTSGIYVFGAQLEEGSYPTSYIPTNGTAITRAAETANGSGDAATFNSTEGVLMAEIAALANDGTNRFISLTNGVTDATNISLAFTTTTNQIRILVDISYVLQMSLTYTVNSVLDFNKIILKYKENDFALWVNGFEVATDPSGTVPTANYISDLSFQRISSLQFYGKTRELQYFNSALTDAQLETLTSWTSLQEMITSQLYTNY